MTIGRIPRLAALTGVVAGALATSSPALADTTLSNSPPASCTNPVLSQVFSSYGDSNQYALVPGGTFDDPSGGGWMLSNGATISPSNQPDGKNGGVLNLPSRGLAISPVTCVTAQYPTARMFVKNAAGADSVYVGATYWKNGSWAMPAYGGAARGNGTSWTLSNDLDVSPDINIAGWQYVRFILYGGGYGGRFQVDDFWVDPRASR